MSKEITLSVNSKIVNSKDEAKKLLNFVTMTFDLDKDDDKTKLIQVLQFNNHSVNSWNGSRNSRNNNGVYGIALDFDKGNLTFKNAIKRFQDYFNIIYTTTSHTPDEPRLRVILPFGTILYTNGTKEFYANCKAIFQDADSSCFEPGRILFPCCPPGREIFQCNINIDGEWYRLPSVQPLKSNSGKSITKMELPADIIVSFPNGESIKFEDITEKKPCHCPAPDNHKDGKDEHASAFCAVKSENNQPYIYCSACSMTFFCKGNYGSGFQTKIKTGISPEDFKFAFSHFDYEFRLNELTDGVDVKAEKLTGVSDFVPLRDNVELAIIANMCGAGFRKNLVIPNFTTQALANKHDPVRDYFRNSVSFYDGKNHIDELAKYFTDKDSNFPMLLKRYLIGVVARIFQPTQNFMLTLEGSQGIGKSEFASWLGSPFSSYCRSGTIDPDSKDHRLARSDNIIWEVSELGGSYRKADRERLKSFISDKVVKDRRPYGKRDVTHPAIVSFLGTYNDEGGFLNDPTGNRRFCPVTLTKIDWDYKKKIDINQLWAEVYHLYINGEPWKLLPQEEQIMVGIRESYEVENPLIDLIYDFYEFDPKDNTSFVLSRDLLKTIADSEYKHNSPEALSRKIAQACKKIGAENVRRSDSYKRKVSAYLGLTLRT